MATRSSILPWEIPRTEEPGGLQPLGGTRRVGGLLGVAGRLSGTVSPFRVLFIRGDWNAKVGSQETPGVTGKFGLGIRNDLLAMRMET